MGDRERLESWFESGALLRPGADGRPTLVDVALGLAAWGGVADAEPSPGTRELTADLEAAGAGLPIVSTRFAGIPEIVLDGKTGYLCPPGNERELEQTVDVLVSRPALRRRFGAAARAVERGEVDLALLPIENVLAGSIFEVYDLLAAGKLAGAYLDVFTDEPYQGPLRELPQVLLSCHIGSYAVEARVRMEDDAVSRLLEALGGERV